MMVSSGTRIAGILAVLVGFLISLSGIGAIIGLPLMAIGLIMFLPEFFLIIVVIFVILMIAVLI